MEDEYKSLPDDTWKKVKAIRLVHDEGKLQIQHRIYKHKRLLKYVGKRVILYIIPNVKQGTNGHKYNFGPRKIDVHILGINNCPKYMETTGKKICRLKYIDLDEEYIQQELTRIKSYKGPFAMAIPNHLKGKD